MALKEDFAWIIVTKDRTKVICNKEPQRYELKDFNNIGNSFIRTFKGQVIAKNSLKWTASRLVSHYFPEISSEAQRDNYYGWYVLDEEKACEILLSKYLDIIKIKMTLEEIEPSETDKNKAQQKILKKQKEEARQKQRELEREKHRQELIDKGIIDEHGHVLDKYRDII